MAGKNAKKKRATKRASKQKAPRAARAARRRVNPFSSVGSAIGSRIAGPAGAAAGRVAGSLLGSIFGMGAYTLRRNELMMSSNGPASFDARSGGSCIVSHREFISDISGTTQFMPSFQRDLNPGLAETFPWLSKLAAAFQEYEFLGLVFEFKSTSGVAVGTANTALGVVVQSTNYDVYAPPFSTKQEMEAYQFTTSGSPTTSFYHPVECAPSETILPQRYIRYGAVPATADQRMYDLGKYTLATSGMQGTNVIGELWVTYKVKLMKPRLTALPGAMAHFRESTIASASPAEFFGVFGPHVYPESTLNVSAVNGGMGRLRFPDAGAYCVCTIVRHASTPSVPVGFIPGDNLELMTIFNDSTSGVASSYIGGTASVYTIGIAAINVLGSGSTGMNELQIVSGLTGGTASVDVLVFQLPPASASALSALPRVWREAITQAVATHQQAQEGASEERSGKDEEVVVVKRAGSALTATRK